MRTWTGPLTDDELTMLVYRLDRAAAACYRIAARHEPEGVIWLGEPWADTGEDMVTLRDDAVSAVWGRLGMSLADAWGPGGGEEPAPSPDRGGVAW
jgi:hypothetical protein